MSDTLQQARHELAEQVRTAKAIGNKLHTMGVNITAIAAGGKGPVYLWKQDIEQRQDTDRLKALPWLGYYHQKRQEQIPPAERVGILHSDAVGQWRTFDIDAIKDDDGNKVPVERQPVDTLLRVLGLPADYPWALRSGSGAGWHIYVRCEEALPDGALVEKDKEKGVYVGLPHIPGAFDHLELRWHECQTVPAFASVDDVPDDHPTAVGAALVVAAFNALAKPKQRETPQPDPKPATTGQAPAARRKDGQDIIGAFNATYTPVQIIERNGYTRKHHGWCHPNTSDPHNPGIFAEDHERIRSYSATDPLNDGAHAHDAFSCFQILEHNNDFDAALEAAGRDLGLWNEPKRTPGQTQAVRDDTQDIKDRARERAQQHGRMIDITHENLGRVTHEVWDAMLQSQYAELLFVYGGAIISRENDQITFIDETTWRGMINRVCSFWRESKREGLREVIPPISTVRDTMRFRPDGLRTIERIVTLPVLDRHGNLLGSGYHKDAAILSTSTLEPVAMDVNTAYSLLFDEMLVDFPFADECSLSNAVALLFLPFVREMVGATPLHLIDGNKWGTGKGLLNDLFHTIWTGTPAHVTDLPLNDEEQRKAITTHLMQAPLSVTFDDISWLGGRAIQRALTGQIYEDRLLGHNNKTVLPVRNIWIATGNNVTIAGDMPRRVVLIRLETPHEFPGQRSDTQRTESDLRLWVRENRQLLVSACITLIRHGLEHGQTDETLKMGSFDDYVRVLSKILNGCGLSGFLKNMDTVHERMDDRQMGWKLVVRNWYEKYGTTEIRASDIIQIIESDEDCDIVLDGDTQKSKQSSVGKYLKKNLGTVFNFEVPIDDTTTKTVRVKIVAESSKKGHKVYRLGVIDGNSALESHRRGSRGTARHSVRGTQAEHACVSAHDMTEDTSATSATSAMALQSGKTHIRGGYTFTVESRTPRRGFGNTQYAATLEGATAHGGGSDTVEEAIAKAARYNGIVLDSDPDMRSAGGGWAWLDEIACIMLPDGLPPCDEMLASLGTVEGMDDDIDDWQFMQACRAMEPPRLSVHSGCCVA